MPADLFVDIAPNACCLRRGHDDDGGDDAAKQHDDGIGMIGAPRSRSFGNSSGE